LWHKAVVGDIEERKTSPAPRTGFKREIAGEFKDTKIEGDFAVFSALDCRNKT
jgi:hypothetical protein